MRAEGYFLHHSSHHDGGGASPGPGAQRCPFGGRQARTHRLRFYAKAVSERQRRGHGADYWARPTARPEIVLPNDLRGAAGWYVPDRQAVQARLCTLHHQQRLVER